MTFSTVLTPPLNVAAATLFLVRAVQEGRGRDWALFGVATVLATYAHLFALLVLPAQLLSLLVLRGSVPWRRVAAVATLAVLRIAAISSPSEWRPFTSRRRGDGSRAASGAGKSAIESSLATAVMIVGHFSAAAPRA